MRIFQSFCKDFGCMTTFFGENNLNRTCCKAAMEAEEMARLEELAAEAAQERWLLGSCMAFPRVFSVL